MFKTKTSILDTLDVNDYKNHRLRQTYLTEYEVTIDLEDSDTLGNGFAGWYGYYTPYFGFNSMLAPKDFPIEIVESLAFYEIWYWKHGVPVEEVNSKAYETVCKEYWYKFFKNR